MIRGRYYEMHTSKDLYGLLGLPKGTSQDDIRKAHRKLVRNHHPDANPSDLGAEERFKEIQEAYEVLSDPERRRRYDERLRASSGASPGRQRPRTRARTSKEAAATADLSDLLRKLAGLSSGRHGGSKAATSSPRGEELARLARSLGLNITRLSKSMGEVLKTGAGSKGSSATDESREKPSGVTKTPRQKRERGEKKVKGPKARRRKRGG